MNSVYHKLFFFYITYYFNFCVKIFSINAKYYEDTILMFNKYIISIFFIKKILFRDKNQLAYNIFSI